MNVKELIKELQKLPQDIEVRYSIDKGRGKQTICVVNKVETLQNARAILTFQDR